MSLVEAVANVLVGFGVAIATQVLVFPLFGIAASLSENLAIGGVFTLVSIFLVLPATRVRGDPRAGADEYRQAVNPAASVVALFHSAMR
jgi:hypothetical protein